MADEPILLSDDESQDVKPAPKRRRILDPSAIVPVPIYSNKVSRGLRLKPAAPTFSAKETSDDDGADDGFWPQFGDAPAAVCCLSESEEEEEEEPEVTKTRREPEAVRCPSPPPESPVQKQSRRVKQKISEVDRKLRVVTSLLSPEPPDRKRRCRGRRPSPGDVIIDDDVVISDDIMSSPSSSAHQIPLKIRCRTDVHKIPVLPSTPLRDVVTQLSVILNAPPPRLLLLRDDEELRTDATVGELGLGIADIIECVVMAAEDKREPGGGDVITVRLQSKDRDSSQEFRLHRDAPLGSIFSRFLSSSSSRSEASVRFHFDGCKVTPAQTPAQLDMEDGDIIEVWI